MQGKKYLLKFDLEAILFFLIFLATNNFVGRFYYCYTICFAMVLFLCRFKINVPKNSILLLTIGLSVVAFSIHPVTLTNTIKPFVYLFAYLTGANIFLSSHSQKEDEKTFEKLVMIIVFGAFAHLVLNMVFNIGNDSVYRNTIDFWSREEMSATGQAALGSLAIAVSVALLFSKPNLKLKIVAVVLLGTTLFYNLTLGGRTLILLTGIEFLLAFGMLVLHNKNAFRVLLKTFFVLVIVCLALYVAYDNDLLGIKTAFENSNLYDRFFAPDATTDIGHDTRMEYRLVYLKNMIGSLWGGSKVYLTLHQYAHDLLMDAYDESGIFTLISLIMMLLSSIVKIVKVILSKIISNKTKTLVVCVYGAIFVMFFLEPIFWGYQWLFASYCMIDAALQLLLERNKVSIEQGSL